MKKEYLIPTIKTMRMAEPLMDGATVSNSEIGEGFEEGAKDTDMGDEDFGSIFTNKSVWDD